MWFEKKIIWDFFLKPQVKNSKTSLLLKYQLFILMMILMMSNLAIFSLIAHAFGIISK